MHIEVDNLPKIDIRPGARILSVLKHLNYKPWFAMAEFVDNAIQSYLDYKEILQRVDGINYKLKINIDISSEQGGKITIRDNAAGIHAKDYRRAFRTAEPPPSRNGLSEFGVGMKSAACWFAPKWTVRTGALDENVERIIEFDISNILQNEIEELDIKTLPKRPESHYTEVTLYNPHKLPQGRTLHKIKDHLADIYRYFLRDGTLELAFDNELLAYKDPKILIAPFFKEEGKEAIKWYKEIQFDFGQGLRVSGFAAIRETASTSEAGFSLFRRHRLILGSGDDTYRPEYIFGKSNSYVYQRLFGELQLEGFEVSHTKDGFRWEEDEETLLELLKEHIDQQPLPLLQQANGYRARQEQKDLSRAADKAVYNTAEVIRREVPQVVERQLDKPLIYADPPIALPESIVLSERELTVEIKDELWQLKIGLLNDPAIKDWVSYSEKHPDGDSKHGFACRTIQIRMSLYHPFMIRFGGSDPEKIELLLRIAASIVIAEISARNSGVRYAGTIKDNINEYLRDALSKA